jgi:DNA gyrase subunit A
VLLPKTPLFIHQMPDGTLGRSAKKATGDVPGTSVLVAHTHARLAFFSKRGTAYGLGVMDLPDLDDKKTEGRLLPGMLGLSPDSDIIAMVMVDQDREDVILTFVSTDSSLRRTALAEFTSIPSAGKMAMKLDSSDPDILAVLEEHPGDADLFLATREGKVLRFSLDGVRVFAGRASRGIRGMNLATTDSLVAAVLLPSGPDTAEADAAEESWKNGKAEGPQLVQLCATGHVKRTPANAYRTMGRGAKGINDKGPAKTIGDVVGVLRVDETQSLYWPDTNTWLAVGDIKRASKAATGGKPFDSLTRLPLILDTP